MKFQNLAQQLNMSKISAKWFRNSKYIEFLQLIDTHFFRDGQTLSLKTRYFFFQKSYNKNAITSNLNNLSNFY